MDQALIVFLDRDGVICEFYAGDFTRKWDDFHFLPGAKEALRLLKQAGALTCVVSNQSGVNRGLFRPEDLADIDRRMKAEVTAAGGEIAASYYCPHTEEEQCSCRKPGTGLFTRAAADFSLDLAHGAAYMVGDSETDIIAGRKLDLTSILVLSGQTILAAETAGWRVQPDHIAPDLCGAIDYIL